MPFRFRSRILVDTDASGYPHVRYEQQIDLKAPRKWVRMVNGQEVEESFTFFDRITTVRGDSTGVGDFPMEYLQDHTGLPMNDDSHVKFGGESKNAMYTTLEAALFRDSTEPNRLSYPSDHPLAEELETQMKDLLRIYVTDRKLLSPQDPDKDGIHDDACSMLALAAWGANRGQLGEIVIL